MIAANAITVPWAMRGYYPHGSGSLIDTFMHAIVSSLAWHAGASIARMLGGWLIVLAVIVGVIYLARRLRRPRRRNRR